MLYLPWSLGVDAIWDSFNRARCVGAGRESGIWWWPLLQAPSIISRPALLTSCVPVALSPLQPAHYPAHECGVMESSFGSELTPPASNTACAYMETWENQPAAVTDTGDWPLFPQYFEWQPAGGWLVLLPRLFLTSTIAMGRAMDGNIW